MKATALTSAQYEVLNLMSCINMKEDVAALKDVLVQFLNSRLQAEIERLYNDGTLSDEKMEAIAKQHLRTHYNTAMPCSE